MTVPPYTVHSNGGLMSVETVRRFPVRTCLSGPAAGVVGAAEVARLARASEALAAQSSVDFDLIEIVESDDDLDVDDGVSDAPLVRLVNSVIFQAAEDGASDVHVEPQEDCLLVRYRIDGVLQEVQRIPKRLASGVITRLKPYDFHLHRVNTPKSAYEF